MPRALRCTSRSPLLALVLTCLMGSSCSSPSGPLDPSQPVSATFRFEGRPHPAHEVTMRLERTECYGTCPVSTLVIHGDGLVEWTGTQYVAQVGERTTTLDPSEVQVLLSRFEDLDFYALQSEYTVPVSDMPTTYLTLSIGDRTKRVSNYWDGRRGIWQPGSRPNAEIQLRLAGLAELIDALVGTGLWISTADQSPQPPTDTPIPARGGGRSRFEVALVRRPGYQGDAAFDLGVDSSGNVHWLGREHVASLGERTATIAPDEVAILARRLVEIDLPEAPEPAPRVQSAPVQALTIRQGGKDPREIWFQGPFSMVDRSRIPPDILNVSSRLVRFAQLVIYLTYADRWFGAEDECGPDPFADDR